MSTITGRHAAPRAYPSAKRVMRAIALVLLGCVSAAGYVLTIASGKPIVP